MNLILITAFFFGLHLSPEKYAERFDNLQMHSFYWLRQDNGADIISRTCKLPRVHKQLINSSIFESSQNVLKSTSEICL